MPDTPTLLSGGRRKRKFFIDQAKGIMRELSVSTLTTPVSLADFFRQLQPNFAIGGKPGPEGAVVLYVCGETPASLGNSDSREAIAARVAIEVVMQQVAGMPGAQPLLADLQKRFAANPPPSAGVLAPVMERLADLYNRTVSAMPAPVDRNRMLHFYASQADGREPVEQPELSSEQEQALETLIDRLVLLSRPAKVPDRR